MKIPRAIWVLSVGLSVLRALAFVLLRANQSHDAQWQLSYYPLWISDFPISVLYVLLPAPAAEAIVGPVWWFALPLLAWGVFSRRRKARAR